MSVRADLAQALRSGFVPVIDLTAPLTSETPILVLPPEMGQTTQWLTR
jgi:hypothetical protein